jgi:hypothetical protein
MKGFIMDIMFKFCLSGFFVAALVAVPTANAQVSGRYFLQTEADPSVCLESNAPVDGASVGGASFMTGCGNFTGQVLKFNVNADGYQITSVGGEPAGRCLESNKPGFPQEVLSATFMDDCGPYSGQQWYFERIGDNQYTVTSAFAAGEGRCFDAYLDEIDNSNPAFGAAGMEICNGSSEQVWKLAVAPGSPADADTDGDGITDVEELANGFDLMNPNSPNYSNEVYYFNPASNVFQSSILRLINLGAGAAKVTLTAIDDAGNSAPGGPVVATVPQSGSIDLSAIDLEEGNGGLGLVGQFGNGQGKWRIAINSNRKLQAMSLVQTRDGKLTGLLSTVPVIDGKHYILIANGAANTFQESFIRFINLSDAAGTIAIEGITDSGASALGSAVLSIGPRESIQLKASEIEAGAAEKGLSGSIGPGFSSWHLEATPSSSVTLKVMNLMRTSDGFLTDLGAAISVD